MRSQLLLSVLALTVLACGKEESPPPASPTSASTPTTTAPTTPSEPTPKTTPTPASTPETPPSSPPPTAAADKTFTHSKLGFSFSYPESLTVKEDAKGATVQSPTIANVEDRSGKSKKGIDVSLTITVAVEDGAIPAVAKKTNPGFGDAFPKGSEKDFKEDKGGAEKITVGSATGYRFVMGSHGVGEVDTFLPAKAGKTFVVKCSTLADSQKPKMSEADQASACQKVVSTLKP